MIQSDQRRTGGVFETRNDSDWNPVRLWIEKLATIIEMVPFYADDAASALGVFRRPVGHFVN